MPPWKTSFSASDRPSCIRPGSQVWSPGKILLAGEYGLLQGGVGLSVPIRWGQWAWPADRGTPGTSPLWIKCERALATTFQLETKWDDPRLEGLGSSASFIANIARLMGVDPLALNRKISVGSGCDVATSYLQRALLYTQAQGLDSPTVNLERGPLENCWLVHTGKTQPTEASLQGRSIHLSAFQVASLSALVRAWPQCRSSSELEELVQEHTALLCHSLKLDPLYGELAAHFQGTVKPLGAWGGDYALVMYPRKKVQDPQALALLELLGEGA